MILHAKHFATSRPVAVTVEGGRIAAVADSDRNPAQWVAPAFFDPQINGCLGISFNSPSLTPEQVRTVADTCRAHGVGAFLPTLITNAFEPLRHGFATLEQARDAGSELRRRIPGYHRSEEHTSELQSLRHLV